MNKLALTLTLSLTTSTVFAGAYKCQVDGKTVYQQLPCAGQELVLNTKDTGNGGLRDSEYKALIDIHKREVAAADARLDAIKQEQKILNEQRKELIEERRHKEMVRATILSGNLR